MVFFNRVLLVCLLTISSLVRAELSPTVEAGVQAVMPDVVAWRRDFHEHPELGNREFRTAGIIAAHLRELGMEVQTEVAHTGVDWYLARG
jgi:metal-dependent amidase/aminoacylase/carboxypeptidase family protein